jgi:glycogen debranching enzyme
MKMNFDKSRLIAQAQQVLLGNRHRGRSEWEDRPFDYICPSNVTYPFQWLWDSCFHAIALSHFDVPLAQQQFAGLMQAAQPDGFIPHMILWEREKYSEQIATYSLAMSNDYLTAISQPPVLAQAIERVYQAKPDAAFLASVLPKTKAYYRWWIQQRDPDHDNLIAIIQPDESGLDALPAYDALLKMTSVDVKGLRQAMQRIFDAYTPLRQDLSALMARDEFVIEDVMVNSFYAQGLRALARLCGIANEKQDAVEFDGLAARVESALVGKCYNERIGVFFNLNGTHETPARVITATSLFPLILPSLPGEITRSLVEEHLYNPSEFWLPYPIPCVAASEPSFDPEGRTGLLWRGSTWVNFNWALFDGLRIHHYPDIANDLAVRTCEMIARGGWKEYFSPYTAQGYGAPNFGWTTLVLDFLYGIDRAKHS